MALITTQPVSARALFKQSTIEFDDETGEVWDE
jgi:hypothetical protein